MIINIIVFLAGAQSFSAVVGPNGSGKSNVIDAMLFVFGKRAKQVDYLYLIICILLHLFWLLKTTKAVFFFCFCFACFLDPNSAM